MKRNLVFILLATVTVMLTSCHLSVGKNFGNDDKLNETLNVKYVRNFEKIQVDAPVDVYYTQGDSLSARIEAYGDAKTSDVKLEYEGDRLVISSDGKNNFGLFNVIKSSTIKLYVTSPDIIEVYVRGTGGFYADHIDTDNMNLKLDGTGDIDVKHLVCDVVSSELKGTGDISVNYLQALSSDIKLKGTGNIDVNETGVKKTVVALEGTGDIDVNFNDCGSLDTFLRGTGDITLSGDVNDYKEQLQGTGDINKEGLHVR